MHDATRQGLAPRLETYSPSCLGVRVYSEIQAVGSTHLPSYTVRTGDALKIRFTATLGKEPEVGVGLVYL
jgi:hypothetical protein